MRLIIDCDPGNGIAGANVDDGLALALAIAAPQISLELISIVAGNTPSEIGYSVAKSLLQRLGIDITVIRGASQGLLEPIAEWREKLDHGVDQNGLRHLWKDTIPPEQFPLEELSAVKSIGELVCNNPGEVTLIAIGPLTNIANVIQLYPDFPKSVAEIIIMGGVFNVSGYQKDTNFGVDPEAAHIVLTSGANITLVPMDVTTQTQMLHSDLDYLSTFNNPLCEFLVETIRPWMNYSIETRGLNGCWIHDALTVAWLIDRTIATTTQNYVDVILEGKDRGMTCLYDPKSPYWKDAVSNKQRKPITILNSVDSQLFLSIVLNYIQKY
ncbi:nucleoside hydrolase [Xenorhabdus innexi]|uniref:Hydrolase n=1 Tax=Xenorhabdus innexi TaxID=290109 RepID=A0A1N6MSE6_9GAMM|nr:nucleoside hydrolase [Xenorhabdus innexi]PHM36322.1 hydrolase [Xenorhabdus innexi]SIP71765.1 Inosine-uridine preferring nucleoside hydrolase [Xenorhabdus innexi]